MPTGGTDATSQDEVTEIPSRYVGGASASSASSTSSAATTVNKDRGKQPKKPHSNDMYVYIIPLVLIRVSLKDL